MSRRWVALDSDCVEEWQVEPREDGLSNRALPVVGIGCGNWKRFRCYSRLARAPQTAAFGSDGDTLRAVGVSSAVRVAPLASEETENHYSVASIGFESDYPEV